jgi:hypothetical protein
MRGNPLLTISVFLTLIVGIPLLVDKYQHRNDNLERAQQMIADDLNDRLGLTRGSDAAQ